VLDVEYSTLVQKIPRIFRLLAKRRRAAALQDAARGTMIPEIREASWTAPALWRFFLRRVDDERLCRKKRRRSQAGSIQICGLPITGPAS
jgi:hypothetical protein